MPQELNFTSIMEFVLLGFSEIPNLPKFLFAIFFFIYVIIQLGNGIIILITRVDPVLQIPIYFFLTNISFLESCYGSVTLPRMLINLWTLRRNISVVACATQMCFFPSVWKMECFLLTVMAYNHYMVICNPLHYALIMNHEVCIQLVSICIFLDKCNSKRDRADMSDFLAAILNIKTITLRNSIDEIIF